jgi:hypothetical protein
MERTVWSGIGLPNKTVTGFSRVIPNGKIRSYKEAGMNDPETITTDIPTNSESEPELREWVTPTVEEFPLKGALAALPVSNLIDDGTGNSS